MGRWTPLILMAGGLAILLGTLLGINFPMDGRNAQAPTKGKQSQVLPANINVNSTATGAGDSSAGSSGQSGEESVVQNNNNTTNPTTIQSVPTTTAQGSTSTTGSDSTAQSPSNTSGNKAPIRALW